MGDGRGWWADAWLGLGGLGRLSGLGSLLAPAGLTCLLAALPAAACLLGAAGSAQAASFDCSRANSKLTRAICADPELSQLDEQVWNAYGERIKTLSPAQYEQVRDRHITWRRQRGRYERGMVALAEDYRRHLTWLTHPLLPLEGRYQRADGAEVSVEIDLQASDAAPALIALGRLRELQWLPGHADGSPNGSPSGSPNGPPNKLTRALAAGAPQPSTPLREGVLELVPDFVGIPTLPIQACRFTLRWVGDTLHLATQGACGADFAGDYALQGPAKPWPRYPYNNARAGSPAAPPVAKP